MNDFGFMSCNVLFSSLLATGLFMNLLWRPWMKFWIYKLVSMWLTGYLVKPRGVVHNLLCLFVLQTFIWQTKDERITFLSSLASLLKTYVLDWNLKLRTSFWLVLLHFSVFVYFLMAHIVQVSSLGPCALMAWRNTHWMLQTTELGGVLL